MATLHPEWVGYVAENNGEVPSEEIRNQRFFSNTTYSKVRDQVHTRDATVPARDGYQIPIRIYTAGEHRVDTLSAVIVFFHSGGMVNGGLETEDSA